MNLLERIIADKRVEIAGRREALPESLLRERCEGLPLPVSLMASIRAPEMGLIAEVKHRSPSAGIIRDPFVPADIARSYRDGGAHGLSVLIDERYFGGGEHRMVEVRAAVGLPLLYKEFVVDTWQVWHARKLGASALLLIAAALSPEELHALMVETYRAGMEVLFEVHDEHEMELANTLGARFVGINNRDLRTFTTTLDTTRRLAAGAPGGATLVSESGIRDARDVEQLRAWNVHGILVGEHLLRRPDLAVAVRELMTRPANNKPKE